MHLLLLVKNNLYINLKATCKINSQIFKCSGKQKRAGKMSPSMNPSIDPIKTNKTKQVQATIFNIEQYEPYKITSRQVMSRMVDRYQSISDMLVDFSEQDIGLHFVDKRC